MVTIIIESNLSRKKGLFAMKYVRRFMLILGLMAGSAGVYLQQTEAQAQRQCNIWPNCTYQGQWVTCVTQTFYCGVCIGGPYDICIVEYGLCSITAQYCEYRFCSDVCG